MKNLLRPCLALFILFTLLFGAIYPFVVTAAAQALFPRQAQGSLIEKNGKTIGSQLIGQNFANPRYFWSRPSATSPDPYNASASSGSNWSSNNPLLLEAVKKRVDVLRKADARNNANPLIPVDLVTASGSGLDPHISRAAADYQIPRVAKARHINQEKVRALVALHTAPRFLGVLGEESVNVLELNLSLDAP
jgi:K+-transporting ATPase ATPase C chain